MNGKEQEFYQQQETREGRCIDCGARIAVINGKRTGCDCKPVKWFETQKEQDERLKQGK